MINLAQNINEELKNHELVKEYNRLYDYLMHDEFFVEHQNKLLEMKKKLKDNYEDNVNEFNKISEELKNYPPYLNYLEVKKELNDLFNEISSILSIK